MIETIIIILSICGFLAIGIALLVNYVKDKKTTIYQDETLTIKYEDLSGKEVADAQNWVSRLPNFPVLEVYDLLSDIIRIKYSKIESIKLTIKPKVFIKGKRCKGLSSPTGHYCEIEFGDDEQMTQLFNHEIGHSIMQMNNLPTEYDQHEIMRRLGF